MQSFKDIDLTASRILIVDDHEANVRLLEFVVESAGFRQYTSTTDSREVLGLCATFQPDVILLDLQMPHLDGLAIIESLSSEIPPDSYLPILVLTADSSVESKRKALAAGANDFLSKPFHREEVVLRMRNLLRTRWLYSELRKNNQRLECKVRARTHQLAEAQLETLRRLAIAAEYRDDDTGHHTERVGVLAALLARRRGEPDSFVEVLRLAAPLHDVGKIGIPDRILLKRGGLTPEEFEIVKTHTLIGAEILGDGSYPVLQMAREIAMSHHEKWDGSGYPLGLTGNGIPLAGRIVAVADVFDALTHDRPYKCAWNREEAMAEIRRLSGGHLDPDLVDLFISVADNEGLHSLAATIENPTDARVQLMRPVAPLSAR